MLARFCSCPRGVSSGSYQTGGVDLAIGSNRFFDHKLIKLRLNNLDEQVRNAKFSLVHEDFVQQIFIVREHIVLIHKKIARINLG